MKRIVSLLLVLCFCFGLAACGKSAEPSSASPSAAGDAPAAAAAAPAATAEPAPTPAPVKINLQEIIDELNAEETAQRTEDDPSIGVFEAGKDDNTIVYKFAMDIFQYVIKMAQSGDSENMNAYNRVVDSMPALESSLEGALRESYPELNVIVYLMTDEYSSTVAAAIDGGEIVYDVVNGIGTAPTGITPIINIEDLPPEVQEQLREISNAIENPQG